MMMRPPASGVIIAGAFLLPLLLGLAVAAPAIPAGAIRSNATTASSSSSIPNNAPRRVAKAQVDECFFQAGLSIMQNPPCPPRSRPKVNGAYVFGMTKPSASSDIWFGTGENNQCLIYGSTARQRRTGCCFTIRLSQN